MISLMGWSGGGDSREENASLLAPASWALLFQQGFHFPRRVLLSETWEGGSQEQHNYGQASCYLGVHANL